MCVCMCWDVMKEKKNPKWHWKKSDVKKESTLDKQTNKQRIC